MVAIAYNCFYAKYKKLHPLQKIAPMENLLQNIKSRLSHYFETGQLSNDDMINIIEHCGDYLNIMTRTAYSKATGTSYNGAKKHRANRVIFGRTFVIDND